MESLIIVLALLALGIIVVVCFIVWRDHLELKLKQIVNEIARVEKLVSEIYQVKEEIGKMLATAQEHTDSVVSQVEGQVKQVKNSMAHLEQRLHVVGLGGEKRNLKKERERNQSTRNKGKTKGNRDLKQKDRVGSKLVKGEPIKINDGEKYVKLYELANKGLSTQEIAQQLNLGHDEVELVLELKGKRFS